MNMLVEVWIFLFVLFSMANKAIFQIINFDSLKNKTNQKLFCYTQQTKGSKFLLK